MSYPLFIRADASSVIGTGHIMRCLALAQAWEEKYKLLNIKYRIENKSTSEGGGQGVMPPAACVVFICAELPEALEQRLRKEGFKVERIDAVPGSEGDARETLEVLRRYLTGQEGSEIGKKDSTFNLQPSSLSSWLVLDGYIFAADYHRAIRSSGSKLLVIDDYNHLPGYECDLLLNQNLGAEQYSYRINSDARLLLGPKYAMLRREFREAAEKEFPMIGKVGGKVSNDWKNDGESFQSLENSGAKFPMVGKNILVTMGGADTHNVTAKVLVAIDQLAPSGLQIKAVLGASNPWHGEVERQAMRSPHKIEILRSVDNMPDLMLWADLAITAAGSTCWELMCLGTPFITIIVADNQREIARQLEQSGYAPTIRDVFAMGPDELKAIIEEMGMALRPGGKRAPRIDASGSARIVAIMEGAG